MKARIQVWGKGFAVRGRSGEFDRLVPVPSVAMGSIEARLPDAMDWGAILEPIYKLGGPTIVRQFASLYSHSETLIASIAPSTDHVGRPCIVLVSATVGGIDWRDQDLATIVAKSHGLANRLATSYARTLAGAQPQIARQVQEGTFLSDREFDLVHEQPYEHVNWPTVIGEVRRWRGVLGLATPALSGLGANVLYGTRDEVERGRDASTRGLFDVSRGKIEPIGPGLELWHKREPASALVPSVQDQTVGEPTPEREVISRTLRSLLEAVTDIKALISEGLTDIRHRRDEKRRRRGE